jgi:hypothetical protein
MPDLPKGNVKVFARSPAVDVRPIDAGGHHVAGVASSGGAASRDASG